MIKIGMLGAGHLGRIHMKLLKEISDYSLIGFYDPDATNASLAEKDFGVKRYEIMNELFADCDAIDIVTPTVAHFECASKAIKNGKHVFVEKPLANTLDEAKSLIRLTSEARVKAMVGHVERFNPAFLAIQNIPLKPMFIETHRLAQFNPRGTDVAVILDLMIHDIDIILKVVNSNVKRISASGVSVVSHSPDIANARIEFDNGCVANVTASRISLKQMRKMRLFQKDAYITVDFLEKQSEIIRLTDERDPSNPFTLELPVPNQPTRYLNFDRPEVKPVNSIKMELELFAKSILDDREPPVTFSDGYAALSVGFEILKRIEKNNIA